MSYVLTNNLNKAKVWPTRHEASKQRDLSYDKVKVISSEDNKEHRLTVVRNRMTMYVKAVEVLI